MWVWFPYFSLLWVYLPLGLGPRQGDCPLALLGTTISWKVFRLSQFYIEQLLGTETKWQT